MYDLSVLGVSNVLIILKYTELNNTEALIVKCVTVRGRGCCMWRHLWMTHNYA